jgi:hypothetical protein
VRYTDRRKLKSCEKPVSVLLCPPQISRGLAQNRARQLMARAMVRTKIQNSPFLEILARPAHGRNRAETNPNIIITIRKTKKISNIVT